MSHHCTRTSANKLMFFENGRRVREGEYRRRYPNHNDQECLTTQQRRQRIQAAIRSLSGVRGEQDRLITECQTRLGRCNQRVAELEAQLLEKNKEFIERERDVRAEMKSDIEDLQNQLRKGKDCSAEIAEITNRMTEELNVTRKEKDEINALLNASTSERERLSNQIGEITQREQNCNAQIEKTQAENVRLNQRHKDNKISEKTLIDLREQEREKREKAEADLINLRAEHQKCNENLERVSRLLSDSQTYQTQLEALRQEHSALQERTKQLEIENASLSSLPAQISVLNQETQVIREQMSNLAQQHLAELSGKTQKFDELQRKYDELSVDLSRLKELEEKCQQNLISDREAHEILRSANSALQGEYDQISEELQNMKRDLKRPVPVEASPALKASIQEVNNDRQELLGEIANLKSLADKNVLDKNELEGRFQALLSAKETIDARIITLENENKSSKKQIEDCEKQKQNFEAYLNKASFDYRKLMTEKTENETKLNEEVKNIRQALEIITKEKAEMVKKMKKLQDDNESLGIDKEQLNLILNQSNFFSQQHIEKIEKAEKALEDATARFNSEILRLNKSCEENVSKLQSQLQSSKTECDRNVQSLQQKLAETEEMLKSKSEQLEGKELTLKTFMEERYQKKSKIEAELEQLKKDFNENNERFIRQQKEWKEARDVILAKEQEYKGDISKKDEIIARINADREKIEIMMTEKEESLNRRLSELQQQYDKCQSQPKAVQALESPRLDALPITRPEGIKIDLSNVGEYQQPEVVMASSPSSISSSESSSPSSSGDSTPMFTPEEREAIPFNPNELSSRLEKTKVQKRAEQILQNKKKSAEKKSAEKNSAKKKNTNENIQEDVDSNSQLEDPTERRRQLRRDFDALKNGGLTTLTDNLDRAVLNMKPFANWNVQGGEHEKLSNIVESERSKEAQGMGNNLKSKLRELTNKQSRYLELKSIYDRALDELNEGIKVWNQAIEEFNIKEKKKSSVESQFSFGKRKKSKRPRSRCKKTIRKRRSTGRR